jgi:hypothetical protein
LEIFRFSSNSNLCDIGKTIKLFSIHKFKFKTRFHSPDCNGNPLASKLPFGSNGRQERPAEAPCKTIAAANCSQGLQIKAGLALKYQQLEL